MSANIFDTTMNIYELFSHIFSFTGLVDKLSFGSTSVKCNKWVKDRLKDKFLCDDLDEFMFHDKNNGMINKFVESQDGILVDFVNNKYDGDVGDILEILMDKKSVIYLVNYCNEYNEKDRCNINNFCYNMMHNKNLQYKNIINKFVINNFCYQNKLKCGPCLNIIYLCVENDWLPPNNFFYDLPDDKLFELMIVAGCHGSFNMFVLICNYFVKNQDKNNYVSESSLHMISILVLYYKNYYQNTSRNGFTKLYFWTRKNSNIWSGEYSSLDEAHCGYNKIIQWFAHKFNLDESLNIGTCNIFDSCNKNFINKIFSRAIKTGSVDEILFYGDHIEMTTNKNIKLLLEIKIKKIDPKISKLIKKIITNKYGSIQLDSFLEIIFDDVNYNKLSVEDPDIFSKNLYLYNKYHDSLYPTE